MSKANIAKQAGGRRSQANQAIGRIRRTERISGELTVPATMAKNEFAHVLESVLRGSHAVITKHNQPKAVLISIDEFERLSQNAAVALDSLSAEFDALLAKMQTPKARAAMKSAYNATPKELGKAALAAARKRA